MKKDRTPKTKRKGKGLLLGFGCGAALLVLIALILCWTGCVGRIVGRTVRLKDVTDFYCTYSTSTNPPHFQRYRFYAAEGKYFFYHEKREGDHWPLREDDITVSGTKELTKDRWADFFDCLRGGTVRRRQESTSSGGGGPWLYLYWRGDHGKIQQFSFASLEARAAFEALCLELAQD